MMTVGTIRITIGIMVTVGSIRLLHNPTATDRIREEVQNLVAIARKMAMKQRSLSVQHCWEVQWEVYISMLVTEESLTPSSFRRS